MPESIGQRTNAIPDHFTAREMRPLLEAVLADNARLRTAVLGLATKLDADVGVTDTNYNATLAAALGTPELAR